MRGCVWFVCLAFPLFFVGLGIALAYQEQRVYARMQPVEATILSLSVDQHRDRRADVHTFLYTPIVRFEYHVDGRRYTSRQFSFTNPHYIAGDFARSVFDGYSEGDTVTAYYDSENPRTAVLERRINLIPYFAVLGGAAGIALLPVTGPPFGKNEPTRIERSGKYFRLRPDRTLQQRLRSWTVCGTVWAVALVAVLIYMSQSPGALPRLNAYEWIGTVLYGGLGPWAAYKALRAYRGGKWLNDAVVWLTRDHLVIGAENPVMYEQKPRRTVMVRKLVVTAKTHSTRVIEEGGDRSTVTETLHEESVTLMENAEVRGRTTFRVQGRLPVPAGLPPSSPLKGASYPRYHWTIETRLELAGGTVYDMSLPVTAHAGGQP